MVGVAQISRAEELSVASSAIRLEVSERDKEYLPSHRG